MRSRCCRRCRGTASCCTMHATSTSDASPPTRLATALSDARLGDLVHGGLASLDADDVDSPRRAFDLMVDAGPRASPRCCEHGRVIGTLSRRSALRGTIYEPNVDASGRLRVAAAIGINGDVAAKAQGARRRRRRHARDRHGARAPGGDDPGRRHRARPRPRHADRRGQHRDRRRRGRPRRRGRRRAQGRRRTRRHVHDAHDDGGRAPAVLRGARDRRGGARARREGVGGRRRALPARRRARAGRRRGIRDDRVVVRGHHRGAGHAAARRIRPALQGELGHGVDEGGARAVRPARRRTSSPARSSSPRASRRRRSTSTRCARRSRTCST